MAVSTTTVKRAVEQILTEDVLSVAEARKELQEITGHRHDKATINRWIRNGVGSPKVKLSAIRLGNQLFTSRQALTRFIEARSTS